MIQDFRFALRTLFRSPAFVLVAVISLGLGIGANTVVFSVFNGLFLRTLPGENPTELVSVYTADFSGPLHSASSYPDYLDLRARTQTLSGLISYMPMPGVLKLQDRVERVYGEAVSANYFQVLGLRPVLGGGFRSEEEQRSTARPVIVISDGMWSRQLGRDPAAIGRTLQINGHALTVVGVAPPGFQGMLRGFSPDFWVPMALQPLIQPAANDFTSRTSRGMLLIGRMKPGVDLAEVQTEFGLLASQLFREYPEAWTNIRREPRAISVLPESGSRVLPMVQGPVLGFVALLLAVVGLVLLIACSNVANLLLARSSARAREIAVRLSLGAGRLRLVRQLLTESVTLSLLAGAFGLLLAFLLDRLIPLFQPPVPIPVSIDNSVDVRVLLFTLGVSALTGILFGLLPALAAIRKDVVYGLKRGAPAGGSSSSRLRGAMVGAQMALSILLLLGAGLFLRSLQQAHQVDPGFQTDRLLLMTVDLETQGYTTANARAFFIRSLDALSRTPGVASASLSEIPDLGLGGQRQSVEVDGYKPDAGEDMEIAFNRVGPRYFETMEIPVLRGRSFTDADVSGSPPVVVVNDAFAQRYWPREDPLGKRLSVSGPDGPWLEVVGIAKTGKYRTLGEERLPFYFLPVLQETRSALSYVVRTRSEPSSMKATLTEVLNALDPSLPVYDTKTGDEHLGFALLPARIAGSTLGVFGLLALLLAAIGVYGVMAYALSQRTREIGIRVALGATRGRILRLVVRQGIRASIVGMAIGLAAAVGVSRFASTFLYGISPLDPWTFTLVPILLGCVAWLACYLPARQAASSDPVVALRAE